jgi:hypothetical protein
MVAETLTAARAAAAFPVFKPQGAGEVGFAYGVYEIAANVEDGDIFEMCRVPAGAVVVDGFVRADNLDTNATETLDMDVGWAANGVEAANPTGFGNLGVWTHDGVAEIKPETQIWYPFNGVLKDGPKAFTNETTIQVEANAAAATGGVGTLYVGVYYIVP